MYDTEQSYARGKCCYSVVFGFQKPCRFRVNEREGYDVSRIYIFNNTPSATLVCLVCYPHIQLQIGIPPIHSQTPYYAGADIYLVRYRDRLLS